MADSSGAGHKNSRDREKEAEAAATRIRLEVPFHTAQRPASSEKGYKLFVPRPLSLSLVLWTWLGVSTTYLGIGAVAAYLRFYRLPEREADFPLLLPGAIADRFWPYLTIVLAFNLVRSIVMSSALRSTQASPAVRLGWTVGILSSLFHLGEYLWGIVSGFSPSRTATTSPTPVACWAAVSLVMSVIPSVLKWVWTPPEVLVPDWTYGDGEKSSDLRGPEEL
ncbi:MAG: hypothetical protein C4317_02905 [Acidimicrobiia bacterium]